MLENNLGKRPLFSVGEEVLLQSVRYPELNGECTVLDVRNSTDNKTFGYKLTIAAPEPTNGWWIQSALRKKHKPSDHSFDSLMADLKSKEPRNAKA